MKLTHRQRQLFRMLANARRPSGRQGEPGPALLRELDRVAALRFAETGDDGDGLVRWPAKERRDLTGKECAAALSLLKSPDALRWTKKWCYGDPEAKFMLADLMEQLQRGST